MTPTRSPANSDSESVELKSARLKPAGFKRHILDLMRAIGLVNLANRFLPLTPPVFQQWIANLKLETKLATYLIEKDAMVPPRLLKQKQQEALNYLLDRIGIENLGDYLEFGVYNGNTLSCMYEVLQTTHCHHVRLFGFDSFAGLPASAAEEDENTWFPGQYNCQIEVTQGILTLRGIDWQQVALIKGWYSDTLNSVTQAQYQITKASLIMIDCDLYSSTEAALNFCAPLIQDKAVLFFDDWNAGELAEKNLGEKGAFQAFLQNHPEFSIEADLGGYTTQSEVYVITRQV